MQWARQFEDRQILAPWDRLRLPHDLQMQPRVLRKAPVAPASGGTATAAVGGPPPASRHAQQPAVGAVGVAGIQPAVPAVPPAAGASSEPYALLDASTWLVLPQAVAELLSPSNADFTVVAALGPQGLGRSAFLNRLLGLPAHPSPAFPTAASAAAAAGRHCTRGLALRVGAGRLVGLDSQPLFSASVLEDMASAWDQPPPPLAAPAAAAASDAKAAAIPFEGVQRLSELQLAVLLLSTCHRLLVFCDGLADYRTYELLAAAEMLARGVPDPSLPPRDPAPAAAGGGGSGAAPAAAQQLQRQGPPPQEHLAEVVLVHVLPAAPAGAGCVPSAAQLEALEARVDAYFQGSRLRRPGALRMRDRVQAHGSIGGSQKESVSYWVLPALPPDAAIAAAASDPSQPEERAWGSLVVALLERAPPPFARRCSELAWLRGFAGDSWRAVRKSPDIAAFYSRVARTQLKGGGGWGLARA